MNIHTVAANLRNTIAGKEAQLEEYKRARLDYNLPVANDTALFATQEFLKLNIAELKRILADVEICCEKATLDSWAQNPDRSGGQFTQDEVDNAGKW